MASLKRKNTNTYKIVKYIIENPGQTIEKINLGIFPERFEGKDAKNPKGYFSSIYSTLGHDNIIQSQGRKGMFITPYGLSLYNELNNKDIEPEKVL